MKKKILIPLFIILVSSNPVQAFFGTYRKKLSNGTRIVIKREDIRCEGPKEYNFGSLNRYGQFNTFYTCEGYFTKQKSSIHKPTLEYINQDCYWSKTNDKYWSLCDAAIYFNLFPYKTLPPLIYPD